MGAKSKVARSIEIEWSGAGIIVTHSGKLNLAASVAEQNAFYVPWGATIKSAKVRQRTGNTAAGIVVDIQSVKAGAAKATLAVPNPNTAGTELDMTITTPDVDAGDVLFFKSTGAVNGGDCDVTLVLVPKE